jgi:hypothetical protein
MKKYFTLFLAQLLSIGLYAQYCLPSYSAGPTAGDSIVSIQSGNLSGNFPGSPSGYNNFTSLDTLTVGTGTSVTLTITNNPGFAEGVAVWIDFNQNNAFEAGERVGTLSLNPGQVGTITFTVPALAPIGFTRLRMVSAWGQAGTALVPCGSYVWGETEDYTVFVRPPIANDIETVSIQPYGIDCGLSAAEIVSATFENNGFNSATNLSVGYRINGGTPVTAVIPGPLVAGSVTPYSFATTANFSATNTTFTLKVWAALPGDQVPANDTATYVFTTPPPTIATFPYSQNFDSGAGGWVAGGANSTWALGTPAKTVINSAASAPNSWVTGGLGTGTYLGNDNSFVASPCFDFTNIAVPIIKLKVWWESETNWDGAQLQSTIDGGLTWQPVGSIGNPNNWYNNTILFGPGTGRQVWGGGGFGGGGSGGWLQAENFLTGLGGQPSVKLRIAFIADGAVSFDGFAFDDVEIFEAPVRNLKMLSLDEPATGCGLSASEDVTVTYTHIGSLPVNGVSFSYRVNGGPIVTETTTTVVNPGDTLSYTFATTANLATPNDYDFVAWVTGTGDTDNTNDTTFTTVTSIPVVSTFPYNEGFEGGSGGWVAGGQNSTWVRGTPAKTNIIGAASGANAWVTGGLGTGTYSANDNSFVLGPCFDFTTLVNPVIRMDVWWFSETAWDGAYLQYSLDNGLTWINVGAAGNPNNWYPSTLQFGPGAGQDAWNGSFAASSGGWVEAQNFLAGLGGQSNVLLRIGFISDGSVQYDGFAFDNIRIFDPSPRDIALLSVDEPVGDACGLSPTSTIKVTYAHLGTQPVANINFSYRVNNGTVVTENSGILVNPGDTLQYTFVTPANLSNIGTYDIDTWLAANADTDNTNDSILNYTITNIAPISVFPYIQDFDLWPQTPGFNPGAPVIALQDNWTNLQTDNPQDWAVWSGSTPSFGTGPVGDHTSGTGRYLYLEDSGFDNDSVVMVTPCIDVTSLANGRMSFWYHSNESGGGVNAANVNELFVDLIDDGVVTYNFIPPIAHVNNNWNQVLVPLTGLSGIVSFRFRVNNDNFNFTHDIAIDDFVVEDLLPIDAGVTAVTEPFSACGLSAAEPFTVRIRNFGQNPLTSVPISYTLNGVPGPAATFTGTIAPGASVLYTLPTTLNMATIGLYNISVSAVVPGDPNTANNTFTTTVEHENGISTYPYFEDFETGQGGWLSGGAASTWAFGTPAKLTINSAGSGINSWVTGGLGTTRYNNNENSFVESPCFNLTGLNAPILRMKVWWTSETGWDGSNVQASTDGGLTWANVGNFNDPNNWYNNNSIDGLPGGSLIGWSGSGTLSSSGWRTAERALTGLGGQQNVILRVNFGSDASVNGFDGMAFDDVNIFEAPANNLKMVSYDGPFSGCGLSDSTFFKVTYAHIGSQPVSFVNFSYSVNGGAPVTETLTQTLNPGDTLQYTYTTPADLSTAGSTYSVDVWLNNPGDTDNANDSINNLSILHKPAISTFPYLQTFDTWPNSTSQGAPVISFPAGTGWENSQNDRPQDWRVWSGQTPSTFPPTITGPLSDHTLGTTAGKYLYVEDSGFDNDSVILLTPCFDISALPAPKFSFWYFSNNNNQPNNENFLFVDLIYNGDIIYNVIAPIGHKGPSWNFVEINLQNYPGVVGFRFRVDCNNANFSHDIAIDDVALVNVPDFDGGVTDLLGPDSGCGLGANEDVTLLVESLGADSISNFNVNLQINGGAILTTTVTDTLEPGGAAAVVFSGQNFSVPGTYTIVAWTSGVAGDPISSNDTLITTVTSIPTVSSFPYLQDFELGQGGWGVDPAGTNSSWAFGTPAKSVIIGAASGSNAWVTGGLGTATYNSGENSSVVGPCFDFTGIASPVFRAKVWWNSEFNWDGAQLQSSTNNGLTWTAVGAVSPTWYNTTLAFGPGAGRPAWSGRASSGNGSNGYREVEQDLTGLGGQSNVLLRINFIADGSVQDNGFAFDDIEIFERVADDVGVTGVVNPDITSCSSDSVPIFVRIENFGTDTQTVVPVVLNITGASTPTPVINGTYTGTLLPGGSVTFVAGYANFTNGGTFNITASTALVGDAIPANDSDLGRTFVTVSEAPPVVFGDSICAAGAHQFTLSATSAASTIFWYDSATGGNRIHIGDTLVTPPITTNTTYYAQAVTPVLASVGPASNGIGGGSNYTFFGDGIVFDAFTAFTLRSVRVYPFQAGNIVVNLLNAGGTVLQTVTVPYGGTTPDTVITLNMNVPAGTGLQLNANGTTTGGLFRNTSGALFPYSITDVMSMTRSINNLNTFYYFFYDWRVEVLGCPSPRVPVQARFLPPVAVDLGADAVLCGGSQLNATTPGVISYQWNGDPNLNTPTLPVSVSGSYYVDVVNASGCSGTDTVNVTVLPSPTVELGNDTSACNSVVLDAGNPGATIAWSVIGQTGSLLNVTSSGTYFVNVTQNGCTTSDTVAVTILPGPIVDLGANQIDCRDVVLNAGNPGSTYLWSNGSTSQSITVSPNTTVSVIATSANGCTDQDTVTVTAGPAPVVDLGLNAAVCDSIILDAGNAGATYLWSNGATTRSLVVDTTGNYSVTVTDAIGCVGTDAVNISVSYSPEAAFVATYTSGLSYNFVNNSTTGNYLWDFGDGTTSTAQSPSHTYPITGSYLVLLTVTNDCGTDTVSLVLGNVSIDPMFDRLIDVYPNPNNGKFWVRSNELSAAELTFEVYDFAGKLVSRYTLADVFGGFRQEIDLSGEAEGAYVLKVSDGQRMSIKRVVRE